VRGSDTGQRSDAANGSFHPPGCAAGGVSKSDDHAMSEIKSLYKSMIWPAVRRRPVPWLLLLATTLAAVVIACR
jgi:hypothetical protein